MDGSAINRCFLKLHQGAEEVTYKVPNPYAQDERDIYFISDPPHLVKTMRNCWNSRILWVGVG